MSILFDARELQYSQEPSFVFDPDSNSIWKNVGEHLYLTCISNQKEPLESSRTRLAEACRAAERTFLLSSHHDLGEKSLFEQVRAQILFSGISVRLFLQPVQEHLDISLEKLLFCRFDQFRIARICREEDVKFQGLCAVRGIESFRIGVLDAPPNNRAQLDLQGCDPSLKPTLFAAIQAGRYSSVVPQNV